MVRPTACRGTQPWQLLHVKTEALSGLNHRNNTHRVLCRGLGVGFGFQWCYGGLFVFLMERMYLYNDVTQNSSSNSHSHHSVHVSGPSGEIVEGSSVTLTCSSDANPPVQNYTWFKEGGTSPVGSGQTYSIISIMAEHTGLYYCVAQNEHGALNGTVTISVKRNREIPVKMIKMEPHSYLPSPSMYLPQDDVQYSTVTPSSCRPVQDDVQYPTFRVQCDGVISTDQQGEPQYAIVTFHHHTVATGSPTQKMEKASVIYGRVNPH
ncbi:hypothetical protein P4O66_004288 [Electrophorus voltai]|uniref:Ig-like domain-containing protein n=1 Tax=Electrophorus voltai TaxID=2609070 RepID=A0AAD8ZNL0_9TELE|nr:hypothetical protein P4O66_004288 [Electrophorus voltai]